MCAIDLPRLGSRRADSCYGFECSLIERVEHTVIRSPVKWNHFAKPVDLFRFTPVRDVSFLVVICAFATAPASGGEAKKLVSKEASKGKPKGPALGKA